MEYQKIIQLGHKDLIWSFSGDGPKYYVKGLTGYGDTIDVDPFPCVSHDMNILCWEVEKTENLFKTDALLRWISIEHEIKHYTNAWASHTCIYNDNDYEFRKKHKIEGTIVMSGKRTIVHPAMTKYLVAHEYGHIIDYWITACMLEESDKSDYEPFRTVYGKMRNVDSKRGGYGGGRWVGDIAEVIADDFRVLIAGVDTDFYIHEKAGVRHPLKCPEVLEFWNEMREKYETK
jgi:hypothetical protein